ncbi:MAG: glycosyltransferase family 4 protein [Verrucomicrobia bacterium]|nr:glycosyltransferase family 4 protein [Verrucomicrobiota bacterium]
MRIVHVITRLIVGGAQENTIATVLGLQNRSGWDVRLAAGPTSGPEGSLESRLAGRPELLTLIPDLVRPVHPWRDVRAWAALVRLFRRLRPDIVHTHSGKAGVLGRLAARRAGAPIIAHTIHGPSFGPFQGFLPNLLFKTAERIAGRATDCFVAVADAMKQQYLAAGIGRPEQYVRIFSGFPVEPYLRARNDPALRRRLGLGPEDFVVGKIARLFRLKGHEDLLAIAPRLAREIPNIRFLLVGDGILRDRFEAMAREAGVAERFRFVGLVPPEQVPAYIGVMDALVHLSYREGLPRALPQALCAGKPVAAWDCDGAGEVCLDGRTGFLLRPGDRDGLAERLILLARDKTLRRRLGETGRRFAAEQFDERRMIEQIAELYERLAVKTGRKASERTTEGSRLP